MKELLPIGSVVLLKGGMKKIMVTGYMAIAKENPEKVYDYSGCIYPEGLLSSDQTLLFFHHQIEEVYFEGYRDEAYALFQKQISEVQSHLEKKNSSVETLE